MKPLTVITLYNDQNMAEDGQRSIIKKSRHNYNPELNAIREVDSDEAMYETAEFLKDYQVRNQRCGGQFERCCI